MIGLIRRKRSVECCDCRNYFSVAEDDNSKRCPKCETTRIREIIEGNKLCLVCLGISPHSITDQTPCGFCKRG